jgi:hypothetical protein
MQQQPFKPFSYRIFLRYRSLCHIQRKQLEVTPVQISTRTSLATLHEEHCDTEPLYIHYLIVRFFYMTSTTTPTYFQTMTSATSAPQPSAPQPSALPPSTNPSEPSNSQPPPNTTTSKVEPHRKPLLRLELRDLSSTGTQSFLRLLHASTALEHAVDTVLRLLYTDMDRDCIPPTRSVTLILRSMGGVAYTTGTDLDDDHKEIHFSTDYISHVPESRLKEEMMGVIIHEMVHCWQWNGKGHAPGGLIEGIADWVRLKAGRAPPHWRRHCDGKWDSGYERTGYFLEWLEEKHGSDVVSRINEGLRGSKYDEVQFWQKCCGKGIEALWAEYKAFLGDGEKKEDEGEEGQDSKRDGGQQDTDQHEDDEEHAEQDKTNDRREALRKARRGGNMMVPVRPDRS